MLLAFLMLILSLAISCWDAFVAGAIWRESTGWMKAVAASALIMAYCGFFQFAVILLALVAVAGGWFGQAALDAVLSLGYLLIIIPVLGSGLILTIESWGRFAQSRSLLDGATSAYNTYAMGRNVYDAAQGVPGAWETVAKFFDGDSKDSDDASAAMVILIIVLACFIAGGFTYAFFQMGKRAAIRAMIEGRQARG